MSEVAATAGEAQIGLSPPPDVPERILWDRWRADADTHSRDELLALHLPYARTVAATYYGRRMHDEIEFADYLQYARIGLLEALERYDPDGGAQFRTFAARRMHGAILDGVERFTEKQQQIAVRQRLRRERIESLKECGEEAAGATPVASRRDDERLFQHLADVGIGLALCRLLEGTGMVDMGDGAQTPSASRPYRSIELAQLRRRIVELVDRLTPQQRTVIRYHYLQEHSFEEVSELMSVTRGRVSQIHRQALAVLRSQLQDDPTCDVAW